MNRSQRRKLCTGQPDRKALYKALQDEQQAGISSAVDMYSIAVAYVLYNKQGFDAERMHETMNQILDLFDSFSKSYLTFNDAKELLKTEANFVMKDAQ